MENYEIQDLIEKLSTRKSWLVQSKHYLKTIVLFNESSLEKLQQVEQEIEQTEKEIQELVNKMYGY